MVSHHSSLARSPRVPLLLGALLGALLAASPSSQAQPRRPGRPTPAASGSASASASATGSGSASGSASASASATGSGSASGSASGSGSGSGSGSASGSPSATGSASPSPSASASVSAPAPAASSGLPRPRVHHVPLSSAPAHTEQTILATLEYANRISRAVVVYRAAGGTDQEIELRRSTLGPYAAVIPAEAVVAPGFSYCIELELVGGGRQAIFAERGAMHEVQVAEPLDDRREKATLARLEGRRSVVTTSAEYVRFGETEAQVQEVAGAPLTARKIPDSYYRIEAGYTYRVLGTIAEFGIRGGVVRGRALVPGQTDPAKFDVGLNYGAPTIRLRASDWVHIEGELLTSVTEVGFSTGGGAALMLGDPYGSKLTLGFESIQTFGTRIYSRFDLASGRFGVAPIIEVTDMPHSKFGLRLLTEGTFDLGEGFRVAARVGYQARDFTSGGPSAGLGLSYIF